VIVSTWLDRQWDYGWAHVRVGARLRACWSTTILASHVFVSGNFAIIGASRAAQLNAIKGSSGKYHLAAVAIERKRNEAALRR